MSKVRAQTLRTRIIGIPARIAHRARKLILHLPTTVAVGDGIRTTLARGSEPTYTIIVLTDSLLLEHDAAGSGGDPGESSMWKRPVRDRDTTSCPRTAFALESE